MRIICLAFVPWLLTQAIQAHHAGCDPDGGAAISSDADGDGQSPRDGDCDDGDPRAYNGAPELCDDTDNDCNGLVDDAGLQPWFRDVDGDSYGATVTARVQAGCHAPGWVLRGYDCNDADAGENPSAVEICDGLDNDCNGVADDGFDVDLDGWAYCNGLDCDDEDPSIYPGAQEACDGVDQDCDNTVDEDVTIPLYLDGDGDGYGNPDILLEGCKPTVELAADGTDCGDADSSAHPGASEQCGPGLAMGDDDCDGIIDEGCATSFFDCTYYLATDNGPEVPHDDVCSVNFQGQAAAYYVPASAPILAAYMDPVSTAVDVGGYECEVFENDERMSADFLFDTTHASVPADYQWRWSNCDGPSGFETTVTWLPINNGETAIQTFWAYVASVEADNAASLYMRVTINNWYPSQRLLEQEVTGQIK